MENNLIPYLLVFLGGFGGGGVAARTSLISYKPVPENPDPPRPPWCWGWCPPLFGAVLAVIIWAAIGREMGPQGLLLSATVVSFVVGTAGGAFANGIENVLRGSGR